MATCGDLTTVVLALDLSAIRRSRSGLIVWSSAATTYHDGFCFQATWLVTPLKTFSEAGCWTQNIMFCSLGGRPFANAFVTPSLERVRNPSVFCTKFVSCVAGAFSLTEGTVSPWSGAYAATYTSAFTCGSSPAFVMTKPPQE